MIYEYKCPRCGEFEVEQKITDPPLKTCPQTVTERPAHLLPENGGFHMRTCGEPVQRLIAGGTGFVLNGKGWFKDGY